MQVVRIRYRGKIWWDKEAHMLEVQTRDRRCHFCWLFLLLSFALPFFFLFISLFKKIKIQEQHSI